MGRRRGKNTAQIKVRLPQPLRAAVERAAKARGVSLNTELVERVERSFAPVEHAAVDELIRRLGGDRTIRGPLNLFHHAGSFDNPKESAPPTEKKGQSDE